MTIRPGAASSAHTRIGDERAEHVTRQQIEHFERALDDLANRSADQGSDPAWRRLEEAALRGQLDDLRGQTAAYEARLAARRVAS